MQKMIAKYIRTISKLPYEGNSLEGGEIDAAGNTNKLIIQKKITTGTH